MCHTVCFEAGRLAQTQSSWTALSCSRKWMSGPVDAAADAWIELITDRRRRIVGQFEEPMRVRAGPATHCSCRPRTASPRSLGRLTQ
jgi:hypothetical protein